MGTIDELFLLSHRKSHEPFRPILHAIELPTRLSFQCDFIMPTLPVWFGYYLGLTQFELGMVALGACLGHIFPIFFKFKGGKGVATAFGAIAPIAWGVLFSMLGTWLMVFLISGYSSLSAVITALLVPFYVWWFKPEFTFPVALVCCLLIYRHHENIQRLWRGQEDKMWSKFKK